MKPKKLALTTAKIAVQLAREDAGRYMTVHELSGHAFALAMAGARARAAIESGQSAELHYEAARKVAEIFRAEIEARGDLPGMVLGLRLSSGQFTAGGDNIFFVA